MTEKKLRQAILDELKKVKKQNAPFLHKLIQTKDVYNRIEEEIIDRVINEKLPPSAIIPHIESELSI